VVTFAVLMKKSPGEVSVITASRMASPVVTDVDSDGDAEDGKKRSQGILSKMVTPIPIDFARAL
jgi:hypothetical protein